VRDSGWESALPEVAAEVEEVPGRSQREQAWGSAAPGATGRGGSLRVRSETQRHGCRWEAQDREQARAGCGVEGGASRNLFPFGHELVILRGDAIRRGDASPQEPAR
jgi:hypothetical protein